MTFYYIKYKHFKSAVVEANSITVVSNLKVAVMLL